MTYLMGYMGTTYNSIIIMMIATHLVNYRVGGGSVCMCFYLFVFIRARGEVKRNDLVGALI